MADFSPEDFPILEKMSRIRSSQGEDALVTYLIQMSPEEVKQLCAEIGRLVIGILQSIYSFQTLLLKIEATRPDIGKELLN